MWYHVKIMIVVKGVRLDMSNRFFRETLRQRIFSKDQFVGSFSILNARPGIIPNMEAHGGLKEIAVEF